MESQLRMVHILSSARVIPVHLLLCYAIRHSANLLPTQPSKALLLLDLSSIQFSHYAINTNSVIWAIRVCVCMCMLRSGGNYRCTVQLFSFSFFFLSQRLQSTNQPSNAGNLKQAERLKVPGNLTETLGALGSTVIFTIHFGGRGGWDGGLGMKREKDGRKGIIFCKTPHTL